MRLRLMTMIIFAASSLLGDVIDQVTLDTATLIGNASGPFTLDFQFIEGNGIGDSNNTITLSNFSFGGGSITTSASSTTGGVSVMSSPFSITLVDSSFYQDIEFAFMPGTTLSFLVDATSNIDTVAPDTFTFAIFNNTLTPIPTTDPNGFDTFLDIGLPTVGSGTQIIASGTDLTRTTINIEAPTVGPETSSVPEPSSLWLVGPVLLAMVVFRRRYSAYTGAIQRSCASVETRS
jgi:hypothetical protein